MLRIIIPSKDRAAQLDLLLRSMRQFVAEVADHTVIVLWRASSKEFRAGYTMLQLEHPGFVFVEEEKFRPDFQKIAMAGEEGYLQILVDDDVFVRPFSVKDREFGDFYTDENIAALSMRMSPDLSYCYTENMRCSPPWFRADRSWFWPGCRGDWGYPHSVDGTIWRRRDVRHVISHGNYTMLHQLEPALRAGMVRPLALCYNRSRLLNIANNTVQDSVAANRHAGGDAAEMNDRYLAGERISIDNIIQANPPSPHCEIEYEWSGT